MQQQEQERTEQATPFKLEESRDRGEIQRSGDFTTFALLAAMVAMLVGWGAASWGHLQRTSVEWLSSASGSSELLVPLVLLGRDLLQVVVPFGLVGMALAILGNILQSGPVFSFAPVMPRFARINPISGFRRLFSKRIIFETFKSLLKLGLLSGVAYGFFRALWPQATEPGQSTPAGVLEFIGRHSVALLVRFAAVLLIIGLIDWAFVRWRYRQQMMMSRREVKEEIKRREGDPQIRSRLRELQRENLKQSRALGRLPDADVLITNPDHVGVALCYVRGEMTAPCVIAKGTGLWLVQMKALAWRHSVPVRQQPPLARRLFRYGRIDQPIPSDTYQDVARLYADLAAERRRTARYEVHT